MVNQKFNQKEINPEQLTHLLAKKEAILLIDVRTIYEYQLEHIATAVSFPIDEIDVSIKKIKELANNKSIITYCSTGARSYQALYILEKNAIEANNLKGGIEGWWAFQNNAENTID